MNRAQATRRRCKLSPRKRSAAQPREIDPGPVMKYGCQQGFFFSPIDPCIFDEFFLINLGRFPKRAHTKSRNPLARSKKKKKGTEAK